jgi:hypothetical protein
VPDAKGCQVVGERDPLVHQVVERGDVFVGGRPALQALGGQGLGDGVREAILGQRKADVDAR